MNLTIQHEEYKASQLKLTSTLSSTSSTPEIAPSPTPNTSSAAPDTSPLPLELRGNTTEPPDSLAEKHEKSPPPSQPSSFVLENTPVSQPILENSQSVAESPSSSAAPETSVGSLGVETLTSKEPEEKK